MWFWINFSPIGQASPPSKKTNESKNDKEQDAEVETNTKLG